MLEEKEKKHAIALSALLYDIGQFRMQANLNAGTSTKGPSEKFFNEHIANKVCIRPIKEYVANIIEGKEASKFSTILRSQEVYEQSEGLTTNGERSVYPLNSFFSKIDFKADRKLPEGKYIYTPAKLSLENVKEIFPVEETNGDNSVVTEKLSKLYNDFIEDIKLLPDTELASFVDSLLYLYEKYLVYVNSSLFDKDSDISLFDHAKTVAALSVCKEFSDNTETPFLIVTADVTGIQSFIYAEDESKSKRLRGRSFYVGLITELFSDYILREFDLPRTNLLMNGGGLFLMILPNSAKNREKLKNVQKEIQRWFYLNFKGDINIVIKSIEATDELYANFPKWYNEISSKLIQGKKQKSIDNLVDIFSYDLDKMDVDEYKTTLKHEQKEELAHYTTEYERNQFILSSLFENIGKVLPKIKYIIRVSDSYEKITELNKKYNSDSSELFLSFQDFGIGYYFVKEPNKFLAKEKENALQSVRVLKLNDTDYLGTEEKQLLQIVKNSNYATSIGFWFVGNYTPSEIESENVLDFESLAEMNNEEGETKLSYPLLGTLRMDVDNLGAIFSQGLDRENNEGKTVRTLSRTVSLSRQFNLFFGGYLNNLAEKWGVYITYSGGDDLFVVASWINALNFAAEVREQFEKFVCNNPYVTISGGLAVHKHNFPIGRAAEQAGEAEDKAKKSSSSKTVGGYTEKNSFTVFDKSLKWDDFKRYFAYGKELAEFVTGNPNDSDKKLIRTSHIHFILQRAKEMFINDKGEETDAIIIDNYFRLIGKIKYYAARNWKITAKEVQNIDSAADRQTQLLGKLVSEKEYLENFVIPASYIVLKKRSKK